MTYLSRLTLDPRNRAAQADLANCLGLHRTILSAFPQAPESVIGARRHFGVLYRLETGGRGAAVLVQSAAPPDWSKLPKAYLSDAAADAPNPSCKPVDASYAAISSGMALTFRLRANPTRRIGKTNPSQAQEWRGKRVDLRKEEDQIAWLRRKGEQGGFTLAAVRIKPDVADIRTEPGPRLEGYRSGRRAGQKPDLVFGSVLFEGELRVTDADRFRDTLVHGVGSGKSYGFGLLSVAPARR